jgi:D-alanyl-D-alanine carboxypeptidase/D-alanyl-D-alanine-endopeptidase (penicillin-binding protein 4)
MKRWFAAILLLTCFGVKAQLTHRIDSAIKTMIADSQFKHAIISLYVIDSKNGKVIFRRNEQAGLAPASCQKVITAATAFELLGNDYNYKTILSYDGEIDKGLLKGNIYIIGSGDPTLGSWRYKGTNEKVILSAFKKAITAAGIKTINGLVIADERKWSTQTIPDGWIWQDIGNYYGAGASALNWRENQFDIILRSGKKIDDSVKIISVNPPFDAGLISEATSAAKGSGDNAYIYLPQFAKIGFVRGSIPVNEDKFVISGAMPDPGFVLCAALQKGLEEYFETDYELYFDKKNKIKNLQNIFYTHTSPPLDSIMYWFLKRSINLYGEALVKTIGYEKNKIGSTDAGVKVIKNFWSENGIEKSALKIIDGSGLSPANRVTTKALAGILHFARSKNWFSSFYYALPEINGIKMKDGYINGVRSYTGYVKSKLGDEYTFSFIVNNFDGSAASVREKMWKVLDVLK